MHLVGAVSALARPSGHAAWLSDGGYGFFLLSHGLRMFHAVACLFCSSLSVR